LSIHAGHLVLKVHPTHAILLGLLGEHLPLVLL
jgi:hypothetical protein